MASSISTSRCNSYSANSTARRGLFPNSPSNSERFNSSAVFSRASFAFHGAHDCLVVAVPEGLGEVLVVFELLRSPGFDVHHPQVESFGTGEAFPQSARDPRSEE